MSAERGQRGCPRSPDVPAAANGTWRPWVSPVGGSPLRQASPASTNTLKGKVGKEMAQSASRTLKGCIFFSAGFQV